MNEEEGTLVLSVKERGIIKIILSVGSTAIVVGIVSPVRYL